MEYLLNNTAFNLGHKCDGEDQRDGMLVGKFLKIRFLKVTSLGMPYACSDPLKMPFYITVGSTPPTHCGSVLLSR